MPDLQSVPQAVAAVLLVPPVNLALLAFVAVALRWRLVALAALAGLLLLALPAISGTLLAALETDLPTSMAPGTPLPGAPLPGAPLPGAIVILGGDVSEIGDTPDVADVGTLTLERLRAGAALSRATHLPVLVTGGVVGEGEPPVAALMARSLAEDFGVTARWIEPASRDTWENARLSAALLRADGIGAAYVVTHAWHMRRALMAFAPTGLAVVAAPTALDRMPTYGSSTFVPRVASWLHGYFALHEWIGGVWYGWRGHAAGG